MDPAVVYESMFAAKAEGFIVTGSEGPLRDGELDRARNWGAALARQAAAPAGAERAHRTRNPLTLRGEPA